MDTNEADARRRGAAAIQTPGPGDWTWLDALIGRMDADAAAAALEPEAPACPGCAPRTGKADPTGIRTWRPASPSR